MHDSKVKKLLDTLGRTGIMRPRDLKRIGIPQDYLWELQHRGQIERLGRGLYALPGTDVTEHHSLAEVCKRAPDAVICLLSALRFHGLTTQSPYEVWIALNRTAYAPKVEGLQLRVMRFSGPSFTEGIQKHTIEGVPVRVYGPAKTVADCFKYRNKIGQDVAIEALRDCLAKRKCTRDDLWRSAKVCRVANVMRPYLEVLS